MREMAGRDISGQSFIQGKLQEQEKDNRWLDKDWTKDWTKHSKNRRNTGEGNEWRNQDSREGSENLGRTLGTGLG